MFDVAGDACHVGEKGCTGQDDGVISDEAGKGEEEKVKVEEESMPNLASSLKYFECKPPNKARCVDGDGNICEGQEEQHDIVWDDVVCSNGTFINLLSADGENSKKEEISDQGCCDEVHGESEEHKSRCFAIPKPSGMLRMGNDAQCAEGVEKSRPAYSRDVNGYMKRKENIDICQRQRC